MRENQFTVCGLVRHYKKVCDMPERKSMEGFRKISEKYHLEKWFKKENLIVLILAGILLIVIALPTKESSSQKRADNVSGEYQESLWEELYGENAGDAAGNGDHTDSTNADSINNSEISVTATADYVTGLEDKLTEILSRIQGVGKVYVMITLQESEELIVEKDLAETQEQTVYETEGNSSVPYVIKTVFPKVEGVAVIAEGAGSGTVTKTITEIVQALFGIELHKIKVVSG